MTFIDQNLIDGENLIEQRQGNKFRSGCFTAKGGALLC